jgi:HlyD family secretion protein
MRQKKERLTSQFPSRIASPESFDELAEIVDSKNWLTIITFVSFISLIMTWSIFAKLPVHVIGKGILIYPRKVTNLESPIRGKIEQVKVSEGVCIKKNQLIAIIEPSDIKQQLNQEKEKLIQLQSQNSQVNFLQQQQTILQAQTIKQQKTSKQKQLETIQSLTPLLKDQEMDSLIKQELSLRQKLRNLQKINPELKQKELENITEQRISLNQKYEDAKRILPTLKKRWEKRNLLLKDGALSEDQVLESEQEYRQVLQSISQLEADLQELELKEAKTQQQYSTNLNTISEYQAQLTELSLKKTQSKQQYQNNLSNVIQTKAELKDLERQQQELFQLTFQDKIIRENKIQETQHNIARLQKQYNDNREIKSPLTGCILELNLSKGGVIEIGKRIGSISLNDSLTMIGVGYFSIGEGKKIELGMKAQVTPDNVKRERFGGIIGTVKEVSPFPITKEAASKIIGNSEIVENLEEKGALIEVKIDLETSQSNVSGYQWSSSSGPQFKITEGTTSAIRINVEKRRPITFILPILREWTGIY